MSGRLFSALIAMLLLFALVGCEQKTGSILFSFAWPAAATQDGLAGLQRLKLDLISRGAPLASTSLTRPQTGTTEMTVAGVPVGTYQYQVTAYAADDSILGTAVGAVRVTEKLIAPVTVTTRAQPGATLTLLATGSTLYVGDTLALTPRAANPDNAAILLPASGLRWSTDNRAVATVDAAGVVTGAGAGTTAIRATCGDMASGALTVTVSYLRPAVDLSADCGYVKPGDPVVLSWSSSHADRVETAVNFNTDLLNGSLTVYPTDTTTYRLAVGGKGGSASDSVTVQVLYPVPNLTLEASAVTVRAGDSVKLIWYSSYASSVTRAENFSTTATNGSVVVRVLQTTTYRMTVHGPGGDSTAEVTVTVPPTGTH